LRALLHGPVGLLALAAVSGCAGNVNDYLEEARSSDPESVREAVIMTGAILNEREQSGHPYNAAELEAIKYLGEVAEKSPDAVNRASAIDSLGRLKRPRLTHLYVTRLDDRSWSVQLEAAKALTRNPDPEAVGPLCRRLDAEIRMEVRLEILKALAAAGGEEALKKLVEVFLDRSARYQNMRLAAYDGLRKLSGKEYAFEAVERWRAFQTERFPAPKAVEGTAQPGGPAPVRPEANGAKGQEDATDAGAPKDTKEGNAETTGSRNPGPAKAGAEKAK
jgi:hypothetical protein